MHAPAATAGWERKLSILLVEDEFLIALDVQLLLEKNGHTVIGPAATVEEALRYLDGSPPDAAVLDVNLRGQLVIPVAERLQTLKVPFVLATAYGSLDFDVGCVLAGATSVGKPVNEDRLAAALAQVVARY